jgi:peroxiredoxin
MAGSTTPCRFQRVPSRASRPRGSWRNRGLAGGGLLARAFFLGQLGWVCQQEAPALAAAARQFTPLGVRFVGVDVADSSASAKAYMQQHGLRYPSLSDPGDRIALEFNQLIPITALPSTLVISPDGRIAGRVIGAVSDHDLRRLIRAAL